MRRLSILGPLLFGLILGGCADDAPTGQPNDVVLISPDEAYLHVKMDGGPLMFKPLVFKKNNGSDSSVAVAAQEDGIIGVQYRTYVDSVNGLMVTTTATAVRGDGVGSLDVVVQDGTWWSMTIEPISDTTDHEFSRMELQLFDPETTVNMKAFNAYPNARVEMTFPANVRILVTDRVRGEVEEFSNIGATFEVLAAYTE